MKGKKGKERKEKKEKKKKEKRKGKIIFSGNDENEGKRKGRKGKEREGIKVKRRERNKIVAKGGTGKEGRRKEEVGKGGRGRREGSIREGRRKEGREGCPEWFYLLLFLRQPRGTLLPEALSYLSPNFRLLWLFELLELLG
jgi:hypothetical protein